MDARKIVGVLVQRCRLAAVKIDIVCRPWQNVRSRLSPQVGMAIQPIRIFLLLLQESLSLRASARSPILRNPGRALT